MDELRHTNFIKQVERTAKRDAYLTALRYLEMFDLPFALETIKMKADSHSAWLKDRPLVYDYATQELLPRGETIDGEKVHEALKEMAGKLFSGDEVLIEAKDLK